MKTFVALCTAGLLAAVTIPLHAAPLQRTDVPADALWVAHADCDALRPTVVGQYLLAEMQKPEVQNKLAAFQAVFNFDPSKDLHGLTLYSTSGKPEDGILLLRADFDPQRLETLAKGTKDHQSASHNQRVIHNWVDDKKPAKDGVKPRTFAAIAGNNLVVFGQSQATVASALDVIDRLATSLSATKTFPELGAVVGGGFIEAATKQVNPSGTQPNAAVFRLAKLMQLQVGEVSRQTTAKLTVEASDADVASSMSSVMQGLISLMKLQQDKPEAVKFANALTLAQDGPVVRINLTMSADELVAGMKAGAARKAAEKSEQP